MTHRTGSSPWLDGTLDRRMAELLAEKRSAGYIGQELGVSRNAVIGRIHRTGMQLQTRPSGNPKPHRKHKPLPKPAAKKFGAAVTSPLIRSGEGGAVVTRYSRGAEALPVPYLGPRRRLLELRPRQCRYAVDDVPPYWFCGAPCLSGSSWCSAHAGVVFA